MAANHEKDLVLLLVAAKAAISFAALRNAQYDVNVSVFTSLK